MGQIIIINTMQSRAYKIISCLANGMACSAYLHLSHKNDSNRIPLPNASTIYGLGKAVCSIINPHQSPYSRNDSHGIRTSRVAKIIADALDLDAGMKERIRRGAILHDFGKYPISDTVNKAGSLTAKEWDLVHMHPLYSRDITNWLSMFPGLHELKELEGPLYHHEREDGSGYPLGKRQESLEAMVIAIADAACALGENRPYFTTKKIWRSWTLWRMESPVILILEYLKHSLVPVHKFPEY